MATKDPDRQAQAIAEHPGVDMVAGVDAMLGRSDIDVVVVATPNRLHAPIATKALASGRHVVVDKPMAMDVAEGERLIEAASRAGRLLTVYHNRRWDGDFLTVRRLLAEGALGSLDSLESRFERVAAVDTSWRESAAEVGGPLRDLGPHLVDQALLLFGPARRVWAQLARRRAATEVDDSVFVAIDHAAGGQSRLSMSLIASRVGPRIRLRGLAAEYVKEDLDVQEAQLLAGHAPRRQRLRRRAGGTLGPTLSAGRFESPGGDRAGPISHLLRAPARRRARPRPGAGRAPRLAPDPARHRGRRTGSGDGHRRIDVGGIGMAATSIGIGLVGAGRMGAILARAIAHDVPGARLVAIADRDRGTALRLADELRVDAVFDSADELVARPDVMACVIAVSSAQHLDVVRQAAAAGREIYCEKPLALTVAQTEAAMRPRRPPVCASRSASCGDSTPPIGEHGAG